MNNSNKPINGLIINEINSVVQIVDSISNLDAIAELIKNDSFVVAYLDYKVLVGKYTNGKFSFYKDEQIDIEYIQRMRVFNKNEELLLWRSERKLKGRLRKDNEGSKISAVDNDQVLFGTEAKALGNYTLLKEERGTEIIIPFTNIAVNPTKDRVKIKTRNYVGYNEIHQATYIDSRFVEFTFGENNNQLEV